MANFKRKCVRYIVQFHCDDPDDVSYWTETESLISNDAISGGNDEVVLVSAPNTMTRTDWRADTGSDMYAEALSISSDRIQGEGSGAGSHTISDMLGN